MKRNKLYSILLSAAIAFGLWLYVINTVSPGKDATISGIPVVVEGETVLEKDHNLMVTAVSAQSVNLRLSGTRSDLNKVNSGNITVKVDVSKIREAGERIALDYDISFPGDVPSNAFVTESKSPSKIYVDVDVRRNKEVPVVVKYTGTKMDNYLYDTENAVLDNAAVTVVGPAAVADQIAYAVVEVDLTDRVESVSEAFRYTLCDKEMNPVDAESITTNVEEVRVDMPIRRIKEIALSVDVVYGGGAGENNTSVELSPKTIRVSGSDAVLNELGDTLTIGTITLSELEKNTTQQTFPITLPEGVTNQTGTAEAQVTVQFTGLKTREFTVENIVSTNVPEGMEVELISTSLTVKVRGPVAEVDKLTGEDITATVDFAGAEAGTATYRAAVTFSEGFSGVGILKSASVSATVQAKEG